MLDQGDVGQWERYALPAPLRQIAFSPKIIRKSSISPLDIKPKMLFNRSQDYKLAGGFKMFGKGKTASSANAEHAKDNAKADNKPIDIGPKAISVVEDGKSTEPKATAEKKGKFQIQPSKTKDPAFQAQVIEQAIPMIEKRERVPLDGKCLAEISEAVGVKNKAMCRKVLRQYDLHPKVKESRLGTISAEAITEAKSKLVELKKEAK
jgi:hypothetical protein